MHTDTYSGCNNVPINGGLNNLNDQSSYNVGLHTEQQTSSFLAIVQLDAQILFNVFIYL